MMAFLIRTFVPLWYVLWCRIYNYFELTYYEIPVPLFKRDIPPQEAWKRLRAGISYRKDDITMLWDVCSHPQAVYMRAYGDCDDHGRLAREFFGESFVYNDKRYLFVGLYSLIRSKKPHHMVAVYREFVGERLISIAQEFVSHQNFAALLRFYDEPGVYAKLQARLIEYCVVYRVVGNYMGYKDFIDCREVAR